MIVTRDGDRFRVIRQVDHQEQCAQLATAWGNTSFTRCAPFSPLIAAAMCHDDGWRAWDEAPSVDDQGMPVNFPDLDRAVHAAFYHHAIDAIAQNDPQVGLIVSMHGHGLYEKRLGLDGIPVDRHTRPEFERRFIETEIARQRELSSQIGDLRATRRWAWAGFRLLQAWDVLSLYVCWHGLDRGELWSLPAVPTDLEDDRGVTLQVIPVRAGVACVRPWPFADRLLEIPIAARWIPSHSYRDGRDLAASLSRAEERPHEIVLCADPQDLRAG